MTRWTRSSSVVALAAVVLAGPACAQTPVAGPGEAAATIGGRTVTVAELDRKWQELDAASYMKSAQERYDIRRRVIDVMIGEHLLGEEAKARGMTTEELLAAEVPGRVQPVSEADLETAYNQMRSQLNGAPLDEVRLPLTQFLMQQRRTQAREAFVAELRAKAAGIEVLLAPPRYTVASAAHDPVRGPASAPVEIVEFSDFQCPFCARVVPTLARLRDTFGDQIKIVFRDFPLTSIHPEAFQAAEAADCAREQDRFWEYHDRLFANQRALATADLKRHAAELGLDPATFDACLDEGRSRARVDEDLQAGQALGVSSTPAVFINGRHVAGAQPYEVFDAIIREELARKK